MIRRIPKENMGISDLGWLKSRFHFSFAEYRNPNNINFGVLRVLNDDIIHPQSGFDMHPHNDMEIISYIVDGEITHKDSMGNEETLKRGEVQYLSAGDGIFHSEYNLNRYKDLRLLQIWIIPPKKGLPKLYGSKKYDKTDRKNKLLNIVSSINGTADIKIYQDINIYVSEIDSNKDIDFIINDKRQIYFVQIEGESTVNNIKINEGDAFEITSEKNLKIKSVNKSHILFIEMKEE